MPTTQSSNTSRRTRAMQLRHRRRMMELESRTPEGRGPDARLARRHLRIALPLVIAASIAALIALYFLGGWASVLVALAFIVIWCPIGWWPEILAAAHRKREHDHLEQVIDAEQKD